MPSDRIDVLGVGHGTEDHVCVVEQTPAPGGKARVRDYFVQPGGQVPTALVALQRWGMQTAYVGPIGDDDGGARQIASLREEGVVVEGCVRCAGVPSQRSFITIDATDGERTIQWYRDRRLALGVGAVDVALSTRARALLLDGEDAEVALGLAQAARRAGVMVVLDADEPDQAVRRLLGYTDVAIVPARFARHYAGVSELGPALRAMCEGGPQLSVATLGAEGAVAWTDGRELRQPAFPAEAVDTTSAGDVFHAGYIFGALRDQGVEEALRFAAAASSLASAALGGRTSIPTLAAVRERMMRL